MDFWEAMCQPAIMWQTEEDDSETIELREENRKLKHLLRKMMEKEIREERPIKRISAKDIDEIEWSR